MGLTVTIILKYDADDTTLMAESEDKLKRAEINSEIIHLFFKSRNTGLEETQAGIKIAGRNVSNLRYADDTTLMAE